MANMITVEVAYARHDEQKIISLEVPAGSNIQFVIDASTILTLFPEIDLTQQKIGIFSKLKNLTDTVMPGDRVEIYRPLLIDPKDARRAKANK